MSEATTISAGIGQPTVRMMSHNELPRALLTELGHLGIECDLLEGDFLREHFGWVAEVGGRLAGAVVCAAVLPATPRSANPFRWLGRLFRVLLGWRGTLPQYVEMLDLPTESEPVSAEVEQALLKHLFAKLHGTWGRVPLVVPERNLAAQLFLRNARYKAVRILHAYYGEEDGYLMADELPAKY